VDWAICGGLTLPGRKDLRSGKVVRALRSDNRLPNPAIVNVPSSFARPEKLASRSNAAAKDNTSQHKSDMQSMIQSLEPPGHRSTCMFHQGVPQPHAAEPLMTWALLHVEPLLLCQGGSADKGPLLQHSLSAWGQVNTHATLDSTGCKLHCRKWGRDEQTSAMLAPRASGLQVIVCTSLGTSLKGSALYKATKGIHLAQTKRQQFIQK
jgi:hypothetical protein